MKMNQQYIYDRLFNIYIKFCRVYKNKDSRQMCCMWSTRNLPDEIFECEQIYDIEKEFDFSFTEDDALEFYNMDFDNAVNLIKKKIDNKNASCNPAPQDT